MQPTVQVSFYATITSLKFSTVERAQAAYRAISDAVTEYRLFKNDRKESIEVDSEGGSCTFRLDRIDSVLINDGSRFEWDVRSNIEAERIVRNARAEAGLPASPRDLRSEITEQV